MRYGARVSVIVPAYDVAEAIGGVIAGLPDWVDAIVVVDDASHDDTGARAKASRDRRVTVLRHEQNRGVGAAITTGYLHALAQGGGARDAFAVMAGDAQMDPDDLDAVIGPVARGEAGYVKGDRFAHPESAAMPWTRRLGGEVFSRATTLALGVTVRDSQCGYTALARSAAARLDLASLWPRYGYPNDLLAMLVAHDVAIAHVPVRPIYFDGAPGLGVRHLPRMAWVIARSALRLREKRRVAVRAEAE